MCSSSSPETWVSISSLLQQLPSLCTSLHSRAGLKLYQVTVPGIVGCLAPLEPPVRQFCPWVPGLGITLQSLRWAAAIYYSAIVCILLHSFPRTQVVPDRQEPAWWWVEEEEEEEDTGGGVGRVSGAFIKGRQRKMLGVNYDGLGRTGEEAMARLP